MTNPLAVAQMSLRATGVIQILLGLVLWTGAAAGLVGLHQLIGFALVISLWVLAFLALRVGVPTGIVAVAVTWGLGTLVLGVVQGGLLPGGAHWVVEVLHFLVGLGAIGIGEMVAARAKSPPDHSPRVV